MAISVEEMRAYVRKHPELKNSPASEIVSIMEQDNNWRPLTEDQGYSLFGWGKDNEQYSYWDLGRSTSKFSPVLYQAVDGVSQPEGSSEEISAYNFLKGIFTHSEESFTAQRNTEGWVSDFVNFCRETFDKDATREKVEQALNSTKSDLQSLEDVLHKRLVHASDGSEVSFEEMFRTRRGVKFSPQKISACQQASEEYMYADMVISGMDRLKVKLNNASASTPANTTRVREFNKAVLKTFNAMGIKDYDKINQILSEINEEFKNDPVLQKYGGGFKLEKLGTDNQKLYGTKYAIMCTIPAGPNKGRLGHISEATQAQVLASALEKRLTGVQAELLGLPEGSTDKDLHTKLENLHKNYLAAFKDAYGTKELSELAKQYIAKQQSGTAYINMGVSIAAMATAAFTSGITAGVATVVAVAQPSQLLERATDSDGLTGTELLNHGKMLLEQLPWMAVGAGVGKLGDMARSFVKLKGLQGLAAKSGKTLDDFVLMMGNRVPQDVSKVLKQTKILADVAGVSTEFAVDMTTTLALRGEAGTEDWVMSFAGALAGSAVNRKLSQLPTRDAKIQHLTDTFKDYKLTEIEAKNILNAMDASKQGGDYSRLKLESSRIDADSFLTGKKRDDAEKGLYKMFENDYQFVEFLGSQDSYKFDQMLVMYDRMMTSGIDPLTGKKIGALDLKNTIQSGLAAAFEFNYSEKAELRELLKSQGHQDKYLIDKILSQDDSISFVADILHNKDFKKYKFSTLLLSRLTPENIEIFYKLINDKRINTRESSTIDHLISTLLSQTDTAEKCEVLNFFIDNDIFKPTHYTDFWKILCNVNDDNIDYIKKFSEKDSFIAGLDNHEKSGKIIEHFLYADKDNSKLALELADLPYIDEIDMLEVLKLTSKKLNTFDAETKNGLNNYIKNFNDDVKAIFVKHGFNLNAIKDILISNSLTLSVSPKNHRRFISTVLANNKSNAVKVLSEFDFSQFADSGIPLKYPRNEFVDNVKNILKDLPDNEQKVILANFGFDSNFDGMINNKPFVLENASTAMQNAADRVLREIENFTLNNEVRIQDSEVKEILDGLIKGMPEFTSSIGKSQHGTHAYTVDIHMLNVLQSAMKDPLYSTLSDSGKTVLKFAALLHDIGKPTGIIDAKHSRSSSNYVYSVLERYNMPEAVKKRIIDVIDDHHWFEGYNTGKLSAEEVAAKCRTPENLAIYKILAKSDLASVNSDFHLLKTNTSSDAEFNSYFDSKTQNIDLAMDKMYGTMPVVFDTPLINGNRFPSVNVNIQGNEVDLKVLNLSEFADNMSLEPYGFAPGVTKDNAVFNIHMTDELEDTFNLLSSNTRLYEKHPIISSSFVKLNQMDSRGTYGYLLDAQKSDIIVASPVNVVSGMRKNLQDYYKGFFDISGRSNILGGRDFSKNVFIHLLDQKSGIKLSDSEYSMLMKNYLYSKKHLSQINDDIIIGNKTIKADDLRAVIDETVSGFLKANENNGDNIHGNTEFTAVDPTIKALVAKVSRLEDCSPQFLNFAKEQNLPIILLGARNISHFDKYINVQVEKF